MTNNPVEQFNRAIKRDYTLRARRKMGTLIQQLILGVRTEGVRSRPLTSKTQPRHEILQRVREMTKAKSIRGVQLVKQFIQLLTGVEPQSTD